MTTSRRLFVLSTMGVGLSLTGRPLLAATPSTVTLSSKQNADGLNLTIATRSKVLYRTYYLGFSDNRRFVVDVEPMTLTPEITRAVAAVKLQPSFARSVRVGQFKENTVRLVIDLADGIDAVASSPNVGLTQIIRVNLSEKSPDDPLAQIVSTSGAASVSRMPEAPKKETPRLKTVPAKKKHQETLVVVIDPGHGFRDVASQARSTVVDMLAETKLRYGIQLGDAVLEELARLGPLHKSTVEYAEFAVLKAQGVPSILVETAFISNPRDETRLTNKREQAHFATAIYKGILTAVERDPSLLKQS